MNLLKNQCTPSPAGPDERVRQKSSAAVQMIDFAAVLAKISGPITLVTGNSWDHQQHPKLLCGTGRGSSSWSHLIPKTTCLRQLLMSYWGCWATYVPFLYKAYVMQVIVYIIIIYYCILLHVMIYSLLHTKPCSMLVQVRFSPEDIQYRLRLLFTMTVKIDGQQDPVDILCAYISFCYKIKLELSGL